VTSIDVGLSLIADIPGLFAGAAVMFALFAWRQYRLTTLSRMDGTSSTPPLIPADLLSWEKRNLLVIYVAAFCIWGASDVSPGTDVQRGLGSALIIRTWSSSSRTCTLTCFICRPLMPASDSPPSSSAVRLRLYVCPSAYDDDADAQVVVSLTISSVPPRILIATGCAVSS
jgi:hypothetical protein